LQETWDRTQKQSKPRTFYFRNLSANPKATGDPEKGGTKSHPINTTTKKAAGIPNTNTKQRENGENPKPAGEKQSEKSNSGEPDVVDISDTEYPEPSFPRGSHEYWARENIFRCSIGSAGRLGDVATLIGNAWMNDEVVDTYCTIVEEQNSNNNCKYMTTHFIVRSTSEMFEENPTMPELRQASHSLR